MKKIFLISCKDNNFYNFRSEMILKLVELGYDVTLLSPYGSKIDYFTDRGCHFIETEMDRRGTNIFNDLKLTSLYWKILKRHKPDIVLTYTSKPSIYAGLCCRILKIPYIVNNAGLQETMINKFPLGIILKILFKTGFRRASCMMYQNVGERNFMQKLLKDKTHYRDLPGSGVNLNMFKFKPYPENNNICFNFVGRIMPSKGINEYLECAKIISKKYPNVYFRIYGDFDSDEYRPIIENLQNNGIIEYMGVKLDMKPAIEVANAAIHPSYYEGMTNVVLEHSAMGRPCIGSNIYGVKEGIENGKTGYVFDVGNVDSMVDAVEKFIELPHKEKEAMGKAARRKMEKEFDRNIVTDIYLEEINKILANSYKSK